MGALEGNSILSQQFRTSACLCLKLLNHPYCFSVGLRSAEKGTSSPPPHVGSAEVLTEVGDKAQLSSCQHQLLKSRHILKQEAPSEQQNNKYGKYTD